MPIVADLGSFPPAALVRVPFATVNPWGGAESWSGLAYLVRPDGQATEAGVGSAFDTPSVGRHEFTINLARAEESAGPGWVTPGRYRVVLYGDPIPPAEEVQGVTAAVFDVAAA